MFKQIRLVELPIFIVPPMKIPQVPSKTGFGRLPFRAIWNVALEGADFVHA